MGLVGDVDSSLASPIVSIVTLGEGGGSGRSKRDRWMCYLFLGEDLKPVENYQQIRANDKGIPKGGHDRVQLARECPAHAYGKAYSEE